MQPRKPPPAFEVWFEAKGLHPESIPLTTLSRALSAVQRLVSGDSRDRDEEETESPENPLSLMNVKRGSAVFDVAAKSPDDAIQNLRIVGTSVEKMQNADKVAFAFNPIEDLSAVAKSLDCKIT